MQKVKDILLNNIETVAILKNLTLAHRYLGELKGLCKSIPNQNILIDTLAMQEAQDSSEIENIITTQDEIFKHKLLPQKINTAAKEVNNYASALGYLAGSLKNNKNILSNNNIIEAQRIIKQNNAGVRKQKGTELINEKTKQVIYTPPNPNELVELLTDLENFINISDKLDPLLKMAIIHHQFESIHPFYDGNGRIGRIINIIYLVKEDLLDYPVLYLSRYINHNKNKYYNLLQKVRDDNSWEEWIIFILKAVTKTAQDSIELINNIKNLQQEYKITIREKLPKIYSQDLLNNIFKHPYTKIAFLMEDIKVTRITASNYLQQLVEQNILQKHKLGKENYYINYKLADILFNIRNMQEL